MKALQQSQQLPVVDNEDEDENQEKKTGKETEEVEDEAEEREIWGSAGARWWESSYSYRSEDEQSAQDYTACSASDCGYCGHCAY